MPILCCHLFPDMGKTAKKVRIDFFTANIDLGYQSCVLLTKISPHIRREKKEMQEYKFNIQI